MDDLLTNDIMKAGNMQELKETSSRMAALNSPKNTTKIPRSLSRQGSSRASSQGRRSLRKRDAKFEEKQLSGLGADIKQSFGAETNVKNERKMSLDFDHKEKMRNQDLKDLLKGKLQSWLADHRTNIPRHSALGIKPIQSTLTAPTKVSPAKPTTRQQFKSPVPGVKGRGNRRPQVPRTVSPQIIS